MMRYLKIVLPCAAFVLAAGWYGHLCGGERRVITVDSELMEAALEGYVPVPEGPLIPADIVAIRVISANEIIVPVRNYLTAAELQGKVKLYIDGAEAGTSLFAIGPGETLPVLYELPFFLTGTHMIEASAGFDKPPDLPEWEDVLDFSARERSEEFDIAAKRKVPMVGFEVEVDGVLSEWEGFPYIFIGDMEDVYPESTGYKWQGAEDLSARIYLGWDSEKIYLAVSVKDDKHYNTRTGGSIWDGDALQFAFIPSSAEEIQPFNLGLALAGGSVQAYQWRGKEGLFESSEYAVARDDADSVTVYEAGIPFESLGMEGKKGEIFGFNAVVFEDDDGSGHDYWLQLSPGLAGGWDPGEFKRFMLWY